MAFKLVLVTTATTVYIVWCATRSESFDPTTEGNGMAKGDRSYWGSKGLCPLGLLSAHHWREITRLRAWETQHASRSLRIPMVRSTAIHPRCSSHAIDPAEYSRPP